MVVEKRGDVFAELHAGRMLLHQVNCGLGGSSWPTILDMLKGAFTKHELIICRFG